MFQMRQWALLVVVVVAASWLGLVACAGPANRTKRQFDASHCDPACCKIPVGVQ